MVELFNIIEPANDAVQSSIVSCDVEVISVYVKHCSQEHGAKFGQDHDNREKFLITNSVFLLGFIKLA